jgi:glycosyltransferase involved in cell wall biosynthesis
MLSDIKNGMATFVMPHFRYENVKSKHFLDKAIDGIMAQTDQNFKLVIVDDLSPCKEAITYLSELKNKYPKKIHIILKSTNTGAGNSRNIAIKWAYENKSPIILYNDQDDISHPQRLEIVRKEFIKDAEATVVYSTFTVIDEEGEIVSKEYLSQDIQEILEGHTNNIVQGKNSWIALGTEKNYTNLTSSTAVKTEVAYKYPFPNVPTCEDSHTWFRYGAHPGNFVYVPNIPSLYRIPDKINSSSRIIFTISTN